MLKDFKRACIIEANKLPFNYTQVDIDVLADGYCGARNTNKAEAESYISALCLRFWPKIYYMYNKCRTLGWDYSECLSKLYLGIEQACAAQAWKVKNINAQTAINQTIDTRIIKAGFYESNLQKNKANYNTMSLDAPLSEGGEDSLSLGEVLEADFSDIKFIDSEETVRNLIQQFVNKKKIVEAIVLDTVAHTEADKVTKKTTRVQNSDGATSSHTEVYHQFWPYRIVQRLSKLPENYDKYFVTRYSVSKPELDVALTSIRQSSNQKLYSKLRTTLSKNASTICKALNVVRG